MNYFRKMCGCGTNGFCVNFRETLWSFLGSLTGISAVGALNTVLLDQTGAMLLIGSFGASAVLLYGAPTAPLSQPRNLLGGHVLSALVGVACAAHLGHVPWLAAGVAVSTAIALMHLTGTLHPPGGATALIAVIGGEPVRALGYLYALVPTLAGALVLLAVALLVNNIPKTRQYPVYWY